jgi:cation diffusion facilitator CzcD-associated flavoprotein CzcO
MKSKEVVVIGAGPYGLSTAAYLQAAGLNPYVIGQPMTFWKENMPRGMCLRSTPEASRIAAPQKQFSLQAFERVLGRKLPEPVPVEDFVRYGEWFQKQVVPDLDTRHVQNVARNGNGFVLTFKDGEKLHAESVVLALGIGQFARRPEQFNGVPKELADHSCNLSDPAKFKGKRVVVIGRGQSALEYAAILNEQQADVEILARADTIKFLGKRWRLGLFRTLTPGPLKPLSYLLRPPTDLGDFRTGRIMANPDKFRKQSPERRQVLLQAVKNPCGSHWLRPRLEKVSARTSTSVKSVEVVKDRLKLTYNDGRTKLVDFVVLATGYVIDVSRYQLLDDSLKRELKIADGYPVLSAHLETSIPGLYMAGVVAERALGPTLRFVCGTYNVGHRIAASLKSK